ncbi:MAG: adenylyltransferase/cytidyltransferase family protein [Candidatus Vogelbacteria bacterium]|nr:adenylyltransferase/cytidyltransferase family protein [Candidatus Vogelbacteria bacterium]
MVNKKAEKKVVIYGGAFNPPHIGHAAAIENIIRLFPCDEVWVMPSADRHDKAISVNGEHRLKMLQIMIDKVFPDSEIPIIVSDMEIKRGVSTTTYETQEINFTSRQTSCRYRCIEHLCT